MARSKDDQDTLKATCRIVGLVEDAHYANLRDPAPPTLYFPAGTAKITDSDYTENLVFMIRSQTDAEAIAAYRATLARYAPNTGIMTFLPLRDQVDQSLGSERLIAILTNVFAGIALLLSAIGIFGLLALRVQQRIPEFGVRIAVGATRGHLLSIVPATRAACMVAIGSVCGLALAGIGHASSAASCTAPRRHTSASPLPRLLALVTVATLAAAIPARRAASLITMALCAE